MAALPDSNEWLRIISPINLQSLDELLLRSDDSHHKDQPRRKHHDASEYEAVAHISAG